MVNSYFVHMISRLYSIYKCIMHFIIQNQVSNHGLLNLNKTYITVQSLKSCKKIWSHHFHVYVLLSFFNAIKITWGIFFVKNMKSSSSKCNNKHILSLRKQRFAGTLFLGYKVINFFVFT